METLNDISKEEKFLESVGSSYEREDNSAFAPVMERAVSSMEELRFPTIKEEYWKYTRSGKIANGTWSFAKPSEVELPKDLPESTYRMVFINGRFDESTSNLPKQEGFTFRPFLQSNVDRTLLERPQHIFEALNTAMPQDGYYISLADRTVLEDILQVVFLYDGKGVISQPRSFIQLGNNAELKISEFHYHTGRGSVFSNVHSEIIVGDQAHLKTDIIQRGTDESFHLQEVYGQVGHSSGYTQNTFTLSGGWTRNNTNIRLVGEFNECNLNGFYIPHAKEHIDNHTIIDHEKPNCQSNELYRGVLLDKSVGVFNGKVFVRKDAQKTNAFQSNGNILVSDTATMNSKPELEIYADDVKCSHGSTTGQLDEDALFYLRARGISKENARKLLINAFAEDVLEKLVNRDLRVMIEDTIREKLD